MKKLTDEAVANAITRNLPKADAKKVKELFTEGLKTIEAEVVNSGGSSAQNDRDYYALDAIIKQLP